MVNDLKKRTNVPRFLSFMKDNILQLLNLLLSALIAILGYLYVDRFKVETEKSLTGLNIVNTEIAKLDLTKKEIKDQIDIALGKLKIQESIQQTALNELNANLLRIDSNFKDQKSKLEVDNLRLTLQLKNIESQMADVKQKLDISSRKVGLSSEMIRIIDDIQPKLNLRYDGNKALYRKAENKVILVYSLSNLGKYSFKVANPTYSLKIGEKSIDYQLAGIYPDLIPTDCSVDIQGYYGNLFPGDTREVVITLNFKKWPITGLIRLFKISYSAENLDAIVETIRPQLKDVITEKRFNESLKFTTEHSTNLGF